MITNCRESPGITNEVLVDDKCRGKRGVISRGLVDAICYEDQGTRRRRLLVDDNCCGNGGMIRKVLVPLRGVFQHAPLRFLVQVT